MSQYNFGHKTFTAAGSISQYDRVKLSTVSVVVAGSDEAAIGFAQNSASSGEDVVVALESRGRTFKGVTNEAVAAGASLYGGANGKLTDTDPGGGTIRYKALEASSGTGAIIEVLAVL
jgi:hypothetical protein